MSETLVIQSYTDEPHPQWIKTCLRSVRALSQLKGWDYQYVGDELFTPLPQEFTFKVGQRGPILSDLGRLLAIKEALSDYQQVIWLDADTLIFNPQAFRLPEGQFGFGRERWIQPKPSKRSSDRKMERSHKVTWKIYRSVCNALCYFERGNPFLDYYIYACESVIKCVDREHIAPQMIGPKLLTALHTISTFPLTQCVGSASPHLIVDLSKGGGQALDHYRRDMSIDEQEAGLNLCHSLLGADTYLGVQMNEEHLQLAIESLLDRGQV